MRRKLNTEDIKRVTIEEFKNGEKIPLIVVLDNVRSLHNVGSVFRTSDAYCVQRVILCGISAVPPNAEIHKSALGAEFSVDWVYFQDTVEPLVELKHQGYKLFAVEQTEQSSMLDNFRIKEGEKCVVIFGNEVRGVQQNVIDLCDDCIEIPQFGTKHSLNVSVAAGIVVWEFWKFFVKQ
ncbi:MAG: RNA methyltransferase [Prevotellaceae bacterium]|nr:RNA methyltransferase [Prevotellaceae bacterium]